MWGEGGSKLRRFAKPQPAASSSQRCAATYKLGVQNISCICNFYPEFIFLHLREKEPISAAKSFNIIGSLKKITYVLDLHRYTAIFILHGPDPFFYLLLFTFSSKFNTLCRRNVWHLKSSMQNNRMAVSIPFYSFLFSICLPLSARQLGIGNVSEILFKSIKQVLTESTFITEGN